MKSNNHPIRFWILMAVLGSSASGADDPPIPDSLEVDSNRPEIRRTESYKPNISLINGANSGERFWILLMISDWERGLKAFQIGANFRILNGDS